MFVLFLTVQLKEMSWFLSLLLKMGKHKVGQVLIDALKCTIQSACQHRILVPLLDELCSC